ncbi:MAG: hypothetical protein ACD_43C00171G0004 [uncultured bacterium]|nr:MAG: hypothetical protein ACD_43C00171G0004 [uncultured bacterium]
MMVDVVVVGGGPAGLTAALYTARRSLRTLIISKDLGGQAATTSVIENYPGVGAIDGLELMKKFRDQAVQYGAEFVLGEVRGIRKLENGNFALTYNAKTVEARAIILAFGLTPRSLNVPGEAELTGQGVIYSAAAGLDQLRNKAVVVIGGGNSAIEAVNILAAVAKQVYLVHRRDRFRAEEILLRKLETHSNVTKCLNAQVTAVQGESAVTEVTVEYSDKHTEQIKVEAVCINIGFMSKTGFVEQLVDLSDKREIIIQSDGSTKTVGIFAAGDITTGRQKQVVVSAGEGCKAALACYTYLMTQAGKPVTIDQDWQVAASEHFIRT